MAHMMRRIVWLSALGGVAAAGWKFWTSQQAGSDNDKGNWAPVPAPAGASDSGAATTAQPFASGSGGSQNGAGAATKVRGGAGSSATGGDKKSASAATATTATSDSGASGSSKAAPSAKSSGSGSSAGTSGVKKAASDGKSKLWVEPGPKGSCPADFPVKANQSSKIYHVPSGGSYGRTKAERCYATPEDAEADGYRASKR